MKICSYIKKFLKILVGIWILFTYKKTLNKKTNKKIFVNLTENPYHRYLYSFVKFFQICGYEVVFRANPYFIWSLTEDIYASLILTEKQVKFSVRKPRNADLNICDSEGSIILSADYFTKMMCKESKLTNEYYVPMAMHPLMYQMDLWNVNIENTIERKNCIFFSGSFDRDGSQTLGNGYLTLRNEKIFNVLDRISIYDFLIEQKAFVPKSYKELELSNQQKDKKVIIVNTEYFSIPPGNLRKVIARYNFFLACPGVVMPFSHNIIEAMSVGTIPIIEKEYADMFSPSLENGINAIIFQGKISLQEQIYNSFSLNTQTIRTMIDNVLKYYEDNLTPNSIVDNVVKEKFNKMYLQGEHHSVYLLRENMRKRKNAYATHN